MLSFPHSTGLAPERYDSFFKWIPSDHYSMSADPDNATLTALVEVTDDLRAEFKADMLPPDPAPGDGWYVLLWNDQGVVHAFTYASRDDAVADVMPYIEDTYSITIDSTDKPQSVVVSATAVVVVTGGPAPRSAVIDAGLDALHESRSSLFSFGIRGSRFTDPLPAGRYTVFANRD